MAPPSPNHSPRSAKEVIDAAIEESRGWEWGLSGADADLCSWRHRPHDSRRHSERLGHLRSGRRYGCALRPLVVGRSSYPPDESTSAFARSTIAEGKDGRGSGYNH